MFGMALSLFFEGYPVEAGLSGVNYLGGRLPNCRRAQAGWMPWTPYADWIFTLVSTGSMLLIVWLVLRPRP
jgi:hypothetical protein